MRNLFILYLLLLLILTSCQPETSVFDRLIGEWKMEKIIQDSSDVTEEHNPFNERTLIFNSDSTFVSDGRPYGKNTGRWNIDESSGELFLDSDAGEGDDSYWLVELENENKMLWKGTRSDFTERFMLIHKKITAEKKEDNSGLKKSNLFDSAEPEVRVRIITDLDTLHIKLKNSWDCNEPGKTGSTRFNAGDSLLVFAESGQLKVYNYSSGKSKSFASLRLKSSELDGELEIMDVPYGTGWWWAGSENRIYEGEIYIYFGGNGKPEVVVQLPLEDYLYGVVPYEIGGDSPREALKAQAVAARSEAVIALTSKLYSGPRHDLTSDVECQVFSGNRRRTAESDMAVDETKGIILSENDKPINAYYASNCGGHSELINNVWPDRPDPDSYNLALSDTDERKPVDLSSESEAREWIGSLPDVYCNPNLGTELPEWSKKNFRWKRGYSTDVITRMISGGKNMGNLLKITPLKRGPSGRIISAKFEFEKDIIEINGELAIRQLWQPALRSSCFVVDKAGDKFILSGAGWGHGVGMCQSGAVAQARQGNDFISILNHYYRKADLISLY